MLLGVVFGEVDDQNLAELVFQEAEVYELQRDWHKALAYYQKAVELHSIELYCYKAAYAATQCQPPDWRDEYSTLKTARIEELATGRAESTLSFIRLR